MSTTDSPQAKSISQKVKFSQDQVTLRIPVISGLQRMASLKPCGLYINALSQNGQKSSQMFRGNPTSLEFIHKGYIKGKGKYV